MYRVSKRMEIAGAHSLKLPYESKCANMHGHNWIVTVYCESPRLTEYGMIVDFKKIKEAIHDKLDHGFINEIVLFNPTAENMAKWICDEVDKICEVGYCYRVDVQESEGNVATYLKSVGERLSKCADCADHTDYTEAATFVSKECVENESC